MNTTKFIEGQRVFDRYGMAARYKRQIGTQHVVRPIIPIGGVDEDYVYLAEEETWSQVFEAPPVPYFCWLLIGLSVAYPIYLWVRHVS